jgi:L-cysteate sulfo-lyase
MYDSDNLEWLQQQPRVVLGHGPTPLEPLDRLSQELGGPRIWLKRDDCTGLASGGNKTRKLEYLMADVVAAGADCVVTHGAVQSNHARQTAAACAKLGLPCHLLLSERVDWPYESYRRQGNVLLDQLLGAQLHIHGLADIGAARKTLLAELANAGKRVYEIPAGGSSAIGALGYSRCLLELLKQCAEQQVQDAMIVHASASAGTQGGLVFGKSLLGVECQILGINVFHPDPQTLKDRVQNLAQGMQNLWPQAKLQQPFEIEVNHAYLGDGYGQPTEACRDAIGMAAQLEGILFDPVYSGKALAALIDQITLGNLSHLRDVILIHTGGSASLGAYVDAFDS